MIQRMVRDFNLTVRIVPVETVREPGRARLELPKSLPLAGRTGAGALFAKGAQARENARI